MNWVTLSLHDNSELELRDITLLPIGGIACSDRIPRKPAQELWIAVAGPLVNVVIAAALYAALAVGIVPQSLAVESFFGQLMLANIVLVVFNMIPAFPMDGGRVLCSLLAMFMDYAAATRAATTVGQFCALGLGLLGLFSGNIMLIVIAGFVFLSARARICTFPPGRTESSSGHTLLSALLNGTMFPIP